MSLSYSTDESIVVMLELLDGDPQTIASVTASIRMISTGRTTPMVVAWQEAQAGTAHGWRLSLPEGLPAQGVYELDARIQSGANSYVTEKILVTVTRAVTQR